MKIIFLGTPEYAIPSLNNLIESDHEILMVITQPDRPSGRGQKLTSPPVKSLALNHNIVLRQTEKISKDSNLINEIKRLAPDLIITAAFGQILSQEIIDIPQIGIWNVHASLLPRWRGAAPIHHAVMQGDLETGVTIMETEAGLDTGPIISQQSIPIENHQTTGTLYTDLANIGGSLLLKTINQYPNINRTPQNEADTTYAHKITKEQATIDWDTPAIGIERQLRAFTPFPNLSFQDTGNNKIKVISAILSNENSTEHIPGQIITINQEGILIQCKESALLIKEVKPPNKGIMSAYSWFNGLKQKPKHFE